MAEVKLIGSLTSPFVMRPRIALNLKGVKYEFLEETSGSKSDLLLKSNPVYKKIPVLIHGDKPICESLIIVEYIDKTWEGHSILPSDALDRANARFWAVYIDDKWFPTFRLCRTATTEEARAEAMREILGGLQLLEGALEKSSKGKAFFGGDSIGYLDIAFGSYLGWIKAIEKMTQVDLLDEAKTPLLASWAEHFSSDAAVNELIPETDKLIEYAKSLKLQQSAK